MFINSFAEDAEERCRHHLEEAVKKDGDNPEAYHLLASFFLSKEEPEVGVLFHCQGPNVARFRLI